MVGTASTREGEMVMVVFGAKVEVITWTICWILFGEPTILAWAAESRMGCMVSAFPSTIAKPSLTC